MGTRARGEGSIYKRKDGLWVAESMAGAKKKYLYARTKKAALEKKRDYERKVNQPVQESQREIAAGVFFQEWLSSIEGAVKDRTYERYEVVVRVHLCALNGRPLSEVSAMDLQRLYKQKSSTLAPRSVQIIHETLHNALGQAVRWGLINKNPAEYVTRPRPQPKDLRTLSAQEVHQLLKLVSGHRFEPVYVLAVTTGMRQGEILGLKWEDVELDSEILRVRRTLWKGMTSAPKTKNSIRAIALSSHAARCLRGYRAKCEAGEVPFSEWVISSRNGTPMTRHNLVNRSWYPLLEEMGLDRMPFHNLRHTCATLLLASNVHPKMVQSLLGHSSIEITLNTYSHVLPEMQGVVVVAMDEILEEPSKPWQ